MTIYYISDGEHIKIGYTAKSVWSRLKSLQTGNPRKLKLLAFHPGGLDDEAQMHNRFASARAQGEWFIFSEQLKHHISQYKRDDFDSLIEAFGVRKLTGNDFRNLDSLVTLLRSELGSSYPCFDAWLNKTMDSPSTVFNVAFSGDTPAGVAIWKPKGDDAAKLCTLMVSDDFRGGGHGRNLMMVCREQWRACQRKRVFVTTSKTNLLPFFEKYGFWFEGVGRGVYDRPGNEPEFYLSKLMPAQNKKVNDLAMARLLTPALPGGVTIPQRLPVDMLTESHDCIVASDVNGATLSNFSKRAWLNAFYPQRSRFEPETGFVVPVKPYYIKSIFEDGKTVYFWRRSCIDYDMSGALLLFYASAPLSGCVAVARGIKQHQGSAKELYESLGKKGVLTQDEVGSADQSALAVEFDELIPFNSLVPLEHLKNKKILSAQPQQLHRLDQKQIRRTIALGGIYAG